MSKQYQLQLQHAFDIEEAIDWSQAIDMNRYFLPLDEDAIAFPGASEEQRIAISQFMGLVINHTIAEMEEVANKLKGVAWRDRLRRDPTNPEMVLLGEQFFLEEEKHAQMFRRYFNKFCETNQIDPDILDSMLPKAYGSIFQRAIRRNAVAGGHAFWWVVAMVEEVSVWIYQQLYRSRRQIDPLYYQIQRKHFEEESRHTNYAFAMLEYIRRTNKRQGRNIHTKIDLVYSEIFSIGWVVAELEKINSVRKFANHHPFFATLASALPLLQSLGPVDLAKRIFVGAPYISAVVNPNFHRLTPQAADKHRALMLPFPRPSQVMTFTSREAVWQIAS